jgi:hypothetical protein
MINRNLMQKIGRSINLPFFIAVTVLIVIVGRNLNPLASDFFSYHDITQPSRIDQFTKELTQLHIPPQIAPDYAFGNGYPVFTFYAPAAYWVTGTIHLIGFEVSQAIKLSFLLSILTAFGGMYILVSHINKDKVLRLLPALLYAVSPWVASEIFVRGNLAEMWCLALLPWGIWALMQKGKYVFGSIILAALFISHNALSLILILFCGVAALVQADRKIALQKYFTALLLSMYFWIPVLIGLSGTYAFDTAKLTNFRDHFLCIQQVWTTSNGWGYGGSAPGCEQDGVSFMIGKLLILTAGVGLLVFLTNYLRPMIAKKNSQSSDLTTILIITLSVISLFLTLYISQPIWEVLMPLQSFQFPWRFLVFVAFAGSYMSIYIFTYIHTHKYIAYTATIAICLVAIGMSNTYFKGQQISSEQAYSLYSPQFTREKAAFAIPEYLPRTVDLNLWSRMRDKSPTSGEYVQLKTQFSAYKPPSVLYTISHGLSFGALACLLCHMIYTKIRKRA